MNPFWHNIFRMSGYEQTLSYFLSTVPVFNKLDKRELKILEQTVHTRNYLADEMIFGQGDIGSGMYIIRSGKVQIFTQSEHGQETEQTVLETGDFFGEVALTASRPRGAAARAVEATVLVGLFRSDFQETVRRHPLMAGKILLSLNRIVSDRLLQCSLQLEELKKHYQPMAESSRHE